jgi:hypothetical protein
MQNSEMVTPRELFTRDLLLITCPRKPINTETKDSSTVFAKRAVSVEAVPKDKYPRDEVPWPHVGWIIAVKRYTPENIVE